ncbi:MAG: TM2 domain-containing protein [Aequorivita antarctica]
MNKYYLQSKMKSTGTAYLCWLFLGCHYAYLGKWGWQFLYWFTLGGFGVWMLIDLFHIPTKVNNYNRNLSFQIESLERR